MYLKLNEKLRLNGAEQFVSIRAQKPDLPLLLYLHGGPGDAALPLVLKYNSALAQAFTLVVWEQRGAGKSYYPFAPEEILTIDTFLRDARCLIEGLLERFGQKKLFLVGHSWGSVLGLRLCGECPELLHAYVGCGQVVDMEKSSRLAWEFAREKTWGKTRERLDKIDCRYTRERWLEELLFVTRQVVKQGGSLYGAKNYHRFVRDFLFSGYYTLGDLLHREKGGLQSIRRLWPELMGVSFEAVTEYQAPVVFLEGRHDRHVSSALAERYFETLTSKKALHWFERSCHFPQWSEPEKFHQILVALKEQALCAE